MLCVREWAGKGPCTGQPAPCSSLQPPGMADKCSEGLLVSTGVWGVGWCAPLPWRPREPGAGSKALRLPQDFVCPPRTSSWDCGTIVLSQHDDFWADALSQCCLWGSLGVVSRCAWRCYRLFSGALPSFITHPSSAGRQLYSLLLAKGAGVPSSQVPPEGHRLWVLLLAFT